jgi:uncharacterized Zn-finger protein
MENKIKQTFQSGLNRMRCREVNIGNKTPSIFQESFKTPSVFEQHIDATLPIKIEVGDYYIDYKCHPNLCLEIDGENIEGVSLINGCVGNCSLIHCEIEKVSFYEATEIKKNGPSEEIKKMLIEFHKEKSGPNWKKEIWWEMKEEKEFLDCPFCGGIAQRKDETMPPHHDNSWVWIECTNCEARSGRVSRDNSPSCIPAGNKKAAILWNRRIDD